MRRPFWQRSQNFPRILFWFDCFQFLLGFCVLHPLFLFSRNFSSRHGSCHPHLPVFRCAASFSSPPFLMFRLPIPLYLRRVIPSLGTTTPNSVPPPHFNLFSRGCFSVEDFLLFGPVRPGLFFSRLAGERLKQFFIGNFCTSPFQLSFLFQGGSRLPVLVSSI